MPRKDLIQYRRGSTGQWSAVNPVLAAGEVGFDTEGNEIRIGDGVRPWASLEPIGGTLSPEQIATAVEAWLAEHPLEGVTQAQLDAAIAAIELTPGPPGEPGKDGEPGEPGAPGKDGDPGPSAVSADAGNLLKLGTDDLVMLDPADVPSGGEAAKTGWNEMPVPPEAAGTATVWWRLRRDGNIVHCIGAVQGTPTGTALGIIPIGYRPSDSLPDSFSWPVSRSGTNSIVNNFSISWRTQARILAQNTVGGSWMVSWPTDDPWPA